MFPSGVLQMPSCTVPRIFFVWNQVCRISRSATRIKSIPSQHNNTWARIKIIEAMTDGTDINWVFHGPKHSLDLKELLVAQNDVCRG